MVDTMQIEVDKGYQLSLDIHRSLEALYPRIERHAAIFRHALPVDARLPRPPGTTFRERLDPIVNALSVKAATTKRAIVTLCELDDGDNAVVLARVMLENACLLEWLIRGEGRQRLESYAMFGSVIHEKAADTSYRNRSRLLAADADINVVSDANHRAVWTHTFGDDKGRPLKSDRPTWKFDEKGQFGPVSVKGLFKELSGGESFEYDVLYGAIGSDIVHSGPLSLAWIRQELDKRGIFTLHPMPRRDCTTIALASSNIAMFLVVDSLTEFIGLDLSSELGPLKMRASVDPHAGDHAIVDVP